jgi:hypothetical protein
MGAHFDAPSSPFSGGLVEDASHLLLPSIRPPICAALILLALLVKVLQDFSVLFFYLLAAHFILCLASTSSRGIFSSICASFFLWIYVWLARA